ncbi:hypothetical protein LA080_010235 [Diaporthe eres]|uniref:Uncharacterized protein n=1 Tax=Diaporthe vaccinii TaxID=105482 RepID=A0ABR4FCL5_9PEZI|nr:hypothetical protein LA080_010235 [Diaporthe eres]
MPGSHDRNTPEEVEGVLVRVLDLRPSMRVPWCARCDRLMYQFLAGLRLSPGATGRQLPELARLMDCWFDPVRWPDFARVVWPKISASLEYKLKGLHDQHKIVNYVDPGGARRTYWPDYTRAWALDNWDGSMAGTVDAVLRDNLIRHGTLDHLPSQAAPTPSAPRQVFGAYEPPAVSRVAEWVDSTVPSSSSFPSQSSTSQPSTSQFSTSQLSTSQLSTSQASTSQPITSLPGNPRHSTRQSTTHEPTVLQPSEAQASRQSSAWSEGGSTLLSTGASAVSPAGSGRRRRRGRRGGGGGSGSGRGAPGAAMAGGSPAEILAMMQAMLTRHNPAGDQGGT